MRIRCAIRSSFVVLCASILAVASSFAQNENETVGFQSNHAFESSHFGESIDTLNGGLNFTIPIGPQYQVSRNLSYQVQLAYGSKIWDHTQPSNFVGKVFHRSGMGLGFILNFGRIYKDVETIAMGPQKVTCSWNYVSPDGNEHLLPAAEADDPCGTLPVNGYTVDGTFLQVDGLSCGASPSCVSGWNGIPSPTNPAPVLRMYTPDNKLVYEFGHMIQVFSVFDGQPLNRTVNTYNDPAGADTRYNRDFGGWYVTKIYDRTTSDVSHPYGRVYVTIDYELQGSPETSSATIPTSHVIDKITDSLGRVIDFTSACASPGAGCYQIPVTNNDATRASIKIMSISVPTFKNTTTIENPTITKATYNFTYAWRAINHVDAEQACPPNSGGNPLNCPQTSANVLTDIAYPPFDNHVGSQPSYHLLFDYGPYDPLRNGEIYSRTLPTGAQIAYTYGVYLYASGDTRQLERKTLYLNPGGPITGEWSYVREGVVSGTAYTNPKYVTTKDPLGNETVYYYHASFPYQGTDPLPLATNFEDGYSPEWNDGANYKIEYYEGNGPTRKLIKSETREYDADHSTVYPNRTKSNVRVTRIVTTYADDGGKQSAVEYRDWNAKGLWRETIESGDDIDGVRKTRTAYRQDNGADGVYDFREVTNGAKILSHVDNEYWVGTSNVKTEIARAITPSTPSTLSLAAAAGDVVTRYQYDIDNNVTQKEMGNQGLTLDGSGNWTNPQFRITYGYQPGAFLVTKRFYDFLTSASFGWLAIDRTRDGNTGLIYQARDTAGVQTKYDYDQLGRIKDITPSDTNEFATQVEYRSVTATSVRQGPGTTYDCDQRDTPGSTQDFSLTCSNYDTLGRLFLTQKRPYDPTLCPPYQRITYDVLGHVTFQSEWLWEAVNVGGYCIPATVEGGTTYDFGDPATFGQTGFRTSDPFGRARTVKTADGKITQTTYFGQSSLVTVKGIANLVGGVLGTFDAQTLYDRDVWGRLVQVVPPAGGGAKADYDYDLQDNLIRVDLTDPSTLAVQPRVFEFDPLNRLRSAWNPENGTEVVTAYDALGNLTGKKDNSGNMNVLTYDSAGRLKKIELVPYPKPGLPVPATVQLKLNTYDEAPATYGSSLGRLTTEKSYDEQANLLHTRSIYYNGFSGRVSKEQNLLRGWNASADILDASILYSYNAFGLVSKLTYPEGPAGLGGLFALKNNYVDGYLIETWDDAICQTQQPSDPPGKACPSCVAGQTCTPQGKATYNAAGGFQVVTAYGNVSTNTIPDARNRPSKVTIGKGSYNATTDSYSDHGNARTYFRSGLFAYDGAGNISRMGNNMYGYDAASRLVQVTDINDTLREQTFTYDGFGNMTEKVLRVNGVNPPAVDEIYAIEGAGTAPTNRLTQHTVIKTNPNSNTPYTVVNDERGSIALVDGRILESDAQNRLMSVRQLGTADSELARYAYDAGGNRVRKNDRNRDLWTFYVRDLQGREMSEFRMTQRGAYPPEWAKHYLYLGGRLLGVRENQVPPPPAGLAYTVVISGTNANVTLTWRANPTNEGVPASKYNVYRSANVIPPAWSLQTPTGVPTPTFAQTVAKNSIWKYSVTAVYSQPPDRESYGSDVLLVRGTAVAPAPGVVASITADPGDRKVLLKWVPNANAAAQEVIGYNIYRRVGNGSNLKLTATPIAQTTFLDQGYSNGQPLVNGTAYIYSARPITSSNVEAGSNPEVTATPRAYIPPGPPIALRAIPLCTDPGKVSLSWTPVTSGTFTYRVYRLPMFAGSVAYVPATSSTGHTDTTTAQNMEYTYWVAVIDSLSNLSEESLHVTVKTRAPSVVSAPKRPFAESHDHVVNLRLPIDPGDPVGATVRVYRKPNMDTGCENYTLLGPASVTSTYADFTDASVVNNVAYDYAFTFSNGSGESAYSPSALATPVEAPSDVTMCSQNFGSNEPEGARQCIVGDSYDPFRRMTVQWGISSSQPRYQPFNATNADGTLSYLMGFRVYRHSRAIPLHTDRDESEVAPLALDYQKGFCFAHPDIPCDFGFYQCPAGDTCSAHSGQGGTCSVVASSSRGSTDPAHTCSMDWVCGAGPYGIFARCENYKTGICRNIPEAFCNRDTQCPTGKVCRYNVCTNNNGFGLPVVDVACFLDSDCATTQKCVMSSAEEPSLISGGEDPNLSLYSDRQVTTFMQWAGSAGPAPQDAYDGSCLTVKAVYRVYAEGVWKIVESDFADNFDPNGTNNRQRCVDTTTDMCEKGTESRCAGGVYNGMFCDEPSDCVPQTGPGGLCLLAYAIDIDQPCAPTDTQPTSPGNLVATSPVAGQIRLDWDPPRSCQPTPVNTCTSDANCPAQGHCLITPPATTGYCDNCSNDSQCPFGQYCKIFATEGVWGGLCRFKEPQFCSGSCPSGQMCESRESEVAGYYVYAAENPRLTTGSCGVLTCISKKRYHYYRTNAPIAITGTDTRTFNLQGLAPLAGTANTFTFRVASFDRGGRISPLSTSSSSISAQASAGIPAPGSVKTIIWGKSAPGSAPRGIRVKWFAGGTYTGLSGYRVWRATSSSGPWCALIVTSNTTTCKVAGTLMTSDLSTLGTGGSTTSFIDDTAAENVTYYYAVTALTSGGESAFSTTTTGLVLPAVAQPLSSPASFTAQAPRGASLNSVQQFVGIYLKWCQNPALEGVTSYNVYRSTTNKGPYTASANLLANISPTCLDARHKCEITAFGVSPTATTTCTTGPNGDCRVIDKTVTQSSLSNKPIYYYVVTAVRVVGGVTTESAFSTENQGRPNLQNGTAWELLYDPDNTADVICGEEISSLGEEQTVSPKMIAGENRPEPGLLAPYRTIGQASGGPTMPSAAPRFTYLQLNHLGAPVVETNASGTDISRHHYMPFGEELPVVSQNTTNKRQFTGHERDDETSFDYMLARYYSSALDRFTAVDPSRMGIDLRDPQTWNRYTYALNNPINNVDLNGLYQRNFHYGWTYMLARQAGFSEEEARTIAQADNDRDSGDTNPFASAENRRQYHGFGANRGSARDAAMNSSDLVTLGQTLHNFQDTFSHEGYGATFGHLFAGHAPDILSNDVNKAVEAARQTFEILNKKAKERGLQGFGEPDMGLLRSMAVYDADVVSYNPATKDLTLSVSPGAVKGLVKSLKAQGYTVVVDGEVQ